MCLKSSVLPQAGLEKNRPNKTPRVSIWQERVLGLFSHWIKWINRNTEDKCKKFLPKTIEATTHDIFQQWHQHNREKCCGLFCDRFKKFSYIFSALLQHMMVYVFNFWLLSVFWRLSFAGRLELENHGSWVKFRGSQRFTIKNLARNYTQHDVFPSSESYSSKSLLYTATTWLLVCTQMITWVLLTHFLFLMSIMPKNWTLVSTSITYPVSLSHV